MCICFFLFFNLKLPFCINWVPPQCYHFLHFTLKIISLKAIQFAVRLYTNANMKQHKITNPRQIRLNPSLDQSSFIQFICLCPLWTFCFSLLQVGVQTALWQGSGVPWCQSHAFLHCLQHPALQLWVSPELQGWQKLLTSHSSAGLIR